RADRPRLAHRLEPAAVGRGDGCQSGLPGPPARLPRALGRSGAGGPDGLVRRRPQPERVRIPAVMKQRLVSRRDLMFRVGEGVSGLALASMLARDGLLANDAPSACAAPDGVVSPTAPRR